MNLARQDGEGSDLLFISYNFSLPEKSPENGKFGGKPGKPNFWLLSGLKDFPFLPRISSLASQIFQRAHRATTVFYCYSYFLPPALLRHPPPSHFRDLISNKRLLPTSFQFMSQFPTSWLFWGLFPNYQGAVRGTQHKKT